jgi:calcineurin-like phosphoesterase family protein
MRVFFISDLHFGHTATLFFENNFRSQVLDNVTTFEQHDQIIVDRINSIVRKRDILYILGDLGNHEVIDSIKCNKRLHLGNHDKHPVTEYQKLENTVVVSCIPYKKHWITHIPIHEVELWNKRNIHGHVHSKSVRDDRYINLSVELTCGYPILFDLINQNKFTTFDKFTPQDCLNQIKQVNQHYAK